MNCAILASRAGGTINLLLQSYALRFVEAGITVLAFGYRYFGMSGGEPRQLWRILRPLEDYAAAVEYARGLDEIDADKVAPWSASSVARATNWSF